MFLKGLLIYCLIGVIGSFLLLGIRVRPSGKEARKQFDEETDRIREFKDGTINGLATEMGSKIAPYVVGILLFAFLWPIIIPRSLILMDEIKKR